MMPQVGGSGDHLVGGQGVGRIAALHVGLVDEQGAAAVEYAILVGLIGAVIILTVQALGVEVRAAFETIPDLVP
jgi:Flp pilus assembly pilin Flp